jgi:hypothetical protein
MSASTTTQTSAGTSPAGITPAPAPQYNGTLRQAPNEPPVYLVINGLLCWIPDLQTMTNLITPGAKIVQDPNLAEISVGPQLTSGAVLAKAAGDNPTYLVTNGQKQWVPNPTIWSDYQFNWGMVQTVPFVVIEFVPSGPDLEGPTS